MQGKSVFGYKVFGPGWLCENSSLRDVDSRDGEIIVYGFGMDFYKSLTEFRQDAGIKCNLKKLAACTSVFSLLRRVSAAAFRKLASGKFLA